MSSTNYRLIASDLDGTLLNESSSLSQETIETIIQVQEQGIRFAICTGRPYYGCKKFIEQLQLEKYNGFFVGQNGQYIRNCATHEVIEKEKLKQYDFQQICAIAQQHGVISELFYETHAYILLPNKHRLQSLLFCGAYSLKSLIHQSKRYKLNYINKLIDLPDLPKICFLGHPTALKKLASSITQLHKYDTFFVNAAWLEVVHMGVSKGAALFELEKQSGIPVSEMIAFGDGENDLTMLEIAGLSCAMKNAMPKPKKIADCIVQPNYENGVAKKCKEIFKIKTRIDY